MQNQAVAFKHAVPDPALALYGTPRTHANALITCEYIDGTRLASFIDIMVTFHTDHLLATRLPVEVSPK